MSVSSEWVCVGCLFVNRHLGWTFPGDFPDDLDERATDRQGPRSGPARALTKRYSSEGGQHPAFVRLATVAQPRENHFFGVNSPVLLTACWLQRNRLLLLLSWVLLVGVLLASEARNLRGSCRRRNIPRIPNVRTSASQTGRLTCPATRRLNTSHQS